MGEKSSGFGVGNRLRGGKVKKEDVVDVSVLRSSLYTYQRNFPTIASKHIPALLFQCQSLTSPSNSSTWT